ncbi:IMPACT family protein [Bathymodiolus japonicus methanotrophic gill symbiont]|uniref:IMPACT family protein n=1 Tax=Bathymodiolus japonicus methanotrophic gill symbiont TaxID=113269 RepID=UPI001C8D6CDC|nr:YigZ family protein [Bathymodiolus japonicus methanotrophic gill symbiont]
MQCVKSPIQIEETIKKSSFIGLIYPCSSEAEATTYLNVLRTHHASANHIAFAYRIKTDKGTVCRFNDAGEPSGTAGKPIFKYIEGHELINVLCVVVRYFGGIKLGAGGLTRAYGNTAKQAIEAADINEFIELTTLLFVLDYHQLQGFEYTLNKFSGKIINKDFTGQVKFLVQLPESQCDDFLKLYPGGVYQLKFPNNYLW